jgi:threonine/homoserine/homoserine lactone efflux protein
MVFREIQVNPEVYFAYLLAVSLLVMVPGPVVGLVVAVGGSRGAGSALVVTAGASVSIAIQLAAAAFGLASILALLGEAFEILRWVCAVYLIVFAIRLWRARPELKPDTDRKPGSAAGFLQGFLVSSTNPKSLVFFAAFFPQFIDPAGSVPQQLLVLTLTFQVIFTTGVAAYGLAAARLGRIVAHSHLAIWRNRFLAVLLGGMAVGLATLRR